MPFSVRSPYGIRTPDVMPSPPSPSRPNWMLPLLRIRDVILPNLANSSAKRWRDERTATNLGGPNPAPSAAYPRKLQREWSGGLRAESIFPASGTTRAAAPLPWPQGRPTGPPSSRTGLDYPRVGPQAARPVMPPRAAPYGQILTADDHRVPPQDLVPVAGGAQNPQNLDYGPAPWRVPFMRRSGLSLQASPTSFGWPVNQDGLAGRFIIAPPVWAEALRGTRAASGVRGRTAGAERQGYKRIPAVYVPREVS